MCYVRSPIGINEAVANLMDILYL